MIWLEQLVDGKALMSGRCGKEVGLEGSHMQMESLVVNVLHLYVCEHPGGDVQWTDGAPERPGLISEGWPEMKAQRKRVWLMVGLGVLGISLSAQGLSATLDHPRCLWCPPAEQMPSGPWSQALLCWGLPQLLLTPPLSQKSGLGCSAIQAIFVA